MFSSKSFNSYIYTGDHHWKQNVGHFYLPPQNFVVPLFKQLQAPTVLSNYFKFLSLWINFDYSWNL